MALSRGVHPPIRGIAFSVTKSHAATPFSFHAKWKRELTWNVQAVSTTLVIIEHNKSTKIYKNATTSDAVGVGWLHCWHLPNVGQKEDRCVSMSYAEHNVGSTHSCKGFYGD